MPKNTILLFTLGLASFAQAQQAWQVSTSRNALTGVPTTMAYSPATDYVGDKDKAPQLAARQSGKTCELFVHVPYTVLLDYARVRYDNGKIESPGSTLAQDQSSVFVRRQFEKIKSSSTVVIEYAPYQETPHAVTFDVRGLPAQFDSCAVNERKNAIEEEAAATRRAAAKRTVAARKVAAKRTGAAEHEKEGATGFATD